MLIAVLRIVVVFRNRWKQEPITTWREGLKIMVKIDKIPANEKPNSVLEHPEWGLCT